MQTTARPALDATRIANALYTQARDQYRAALNAAAAVTCAGPNTRARLMGAVDRAAARHRIAMARLDLMGATHPLDVSDPRD